MTDLETRLRSLADAAAAVAVQPSTDELLAKGLRRRPAQRRWLPVTAVAAATAGIVALAVTRPWVGVSDAAAAGDVGCPGKQTTISYEVSGGSMPPDQLTALVRSRVAALTADGCVTTGPDGTVAVRLGDAGRGSVTAKSFRTDLYLAPVDRSCGEPSCRVPAQTPGMVDGANGDVYVLDVSRKLALTGHVIKGSAGRGVSVADSVVNVELDADTAKAFAVLTASVVKAPSPHNQLAIVVDDLVISAPVVQSAIVDGNVQISGGNWSQQEARRLADVISAPSLPADVTIRPEGAATGTPTSFPTSLSTPAPTATAPRPVPSEGTLPPMPSSGVRGTNTDDPTGVMAAAHVLDAYAGELQLAATVNDSRHVSRWVPGWCGVGIDEPHDGVIIWWKGTPPAAVLAVLARVKAGGVTPELVNTQYDQQTLQPTVDALMKHMSGGKPISSLHAATDCSGVEVGLDAMTAANKAQVSALAPDPAVPLLFQPKVDTTTW